MKHSVSRLTVALTLAGALAACGGGGGEPATPAQADTRLAGQVRDANGAPIAGVRVVLENRRTDEVFGAITEADGRYQVAAKPGVYDVLYDDVDRTDWVSQQHTAVDLNADRSDEVVLQRTGAVPSNQLSGRLTNGSGAPLAGRRLLVIPAIARSPAALGDVPMPSPVTVPTDSGGRFSVPLGQPGQDFEFDVFVIAPEAPELDVAPLAFDYPFVNERAKGDYFEAVRAYFGRYVEEQLDVEKPNGAMQLDIVAGNGVRNLRSASGAPSVVPADAQALADQMAKAESRPVTSLGDAATRVGQAMQRGLMTLVPSAEAGMLINKFVPRWVGPNNLTGGYNELVLENGRIDVAGNPPTLRLDGIVLSEGNLSRWQMQVLSQTTVRLRNGLGWVDSLRGDNQIVFTTPFAGDFKFTDRTGDIYNLMVLLNTASDHTVNFRSGKPDIVKMRFIYNQRR